LSQEIPSSDPVDQGEGEGCDTVGGLAERSRSPAPTVEELVSRMTQRSTRVVEPQAPAVDSRPAVDNMPEPSTTTGAEEPAAAQAEEEAPAETGLVDIASLLGDPIVTVVPSSL
jgi:hypothetical protein